MYVLHVAPFDPSQYPPLINTVHVSASWGFESVIVASAPASAPSALRYAETFASERALARIDLHRFLLRAAAGVVARRGRPTAVVGHNAYGLPVATAIAAATSSPLVYHCHDFIGEGSRAERVFATLERACSYRVSEIWVPAPERQVFAYARRIRAPIRVVRNCPRLVPVLPSSGRLRGWLATQGSRSKGEGRLVTRHGRIGPEHLIREVVQALAQLAPSVEFVVVGHGNEEYKASCRKLALELGVSDRVFFHPFVPHDRLFELLIDGDVASGLYAGGDMNVATPAPNKVYENLALGVPVVVAAGGSLEEDIELGGAGAAVPLRELAHRLGPALAQLLNDQGAKHGARASHLQHFNYEAQLTGTLLHSLRR